MNFRHSILYSLVVLTLIILFNPPSREIVGQWLYRLKYAEEHAENRDEIDAILAEFELVAFKDLDKDYLDKTGSLSNPYRDMLGNKEYYIINGKEKFRPIVNQFQVKDFMPKDQYYKKATYWNGKPIYWLVDRKLLYKTAELQDALERKGYNPKAFKIVNGHRHPSYNKKVGGASKSRHLVGEAVDISVRDINKDGRVTTVDKEIVLDILEKEVIGAYGGIGRYPHSKTAIHYDVRGYKARWNKQ